MTSSARLHAIQQDIPRLAGDVARRAFDTAAEIAEVNTFADLDAAMRPCLNSLGFTNFVAVDVKGRDVRLISGEPHKVWYPRLIESGYHFQDAPFVAAREGASAVFYSDVMKIRDLTPLQRRIAEERREFGLAEGFAKTWMNADGTSLAVAMIGNEIDARDPDVRAAAHILAVYYGMAARRIEQRLETPAKRVSLTDRQRDCLSWVRQGKSATDIGAILGISAYTVHEHVAQACARLGVRTRVQAVAVAMSLRLIDP